MGDSSCSPMLRYSRPMKQHSNWRVTMIMKNKKITQKKKKTILELMKSINKVVKCKLDLSN